MSVFHETMRDILEDVQRFLNCTLVNEHLTAASISHKESLLMKIHHMRNEYPQLRLQLILEPIKGGSVAVNTSSNTADSLPPYTDMHGNQQSNDYVSNDAQEEYYEVCNSGDLDTLKSYTVQQQQSGNDPKGYVKSGFLEKKGKERLGGLLNTVHRRWVTLKDGHLYFHSKQTDKRASNHITLQGYEARFATFITKDESKKNACFEIIGPGLKTHQFVAADNNDAKDWIEAITNCVNNVENFTSNSLQIYSEGSQGSSAGSVTGSNRPSIYEDDGGEVYECLEEDREVFRINSESSNNVEEDLYHDTSDKLSECEVDAQLPVQYRDFYLALWDCKGNAGDELNFKRGDMIKILSREYDEHLWWVGQLNGRAGLVPKQYLMEAYEICG